MKQVTRNLALALILGSIVGLQAAPAPAYNAQPATATPQVAEAPSQRSFATPEEAAAALKNALLKNDTRGLLDIFGHDHEDLVFGADPATARVDRRAAGTEMQQKL